MKYTLKLEVIETMRLRQILIDKRRELELAFFRDDEEDKKHPLVYNVHVQGIRDVADLISIVEDPLVHDGYVKPSQEDFAHEFKPIEGGYSASLERLEEFVKSCESPHKRE